MCLVQFGQILTVDVWGWLGITPRTAPGVIGIITAPLVHGSWGHLVSNLLGLIPAVIAIGYFYPSVALSIHVHSVILGNAMVWLLARSTTTHIGASGWVYALLIFLLVSGFIRREPRAAALAGIVILLNQGLFWGMLPVQKGVSWEGHLYGGVVGTILAIAYRKRDPAPAYYTLNEENDSTSPGLWDYRPHIKLANSGAQHAEIEPHSFRFTAPIWKIEIDTTENLIAVELRDSETHSVSFAAIDVTQNKLASGWLVLPESWWVGLAGCAHGWVLAHGYLDPGLPTHRGIYGWDARSGKLRFELPTLAFVSQLPNGLLLKDPTAAEPTYFILENNETLVPQVIDAAKANNLLSASLVPNSLHLPHILVADTDAFIQTSAQLLRIMGHTPVQQVELYQNTHYSYVAYYTETAKASFTHRFAIFAQGQCAYQDTLVKVTPTLHPEPFIVIGTDVTQAHLVYIREQNELVLL